MRPLDAVAERLYGAVLGPCALAPAADVERFAAEAVSASPGCTFSAGFVMAEWLEVVDAQRIIDWDGYRSANRRGRRIRLTEAQRGACWDALSQINGRMAASGIITRSGLYAALAHHFRTGRSPYEYVVVDEAQDVSAAQLRFLAALVGNRPDGLFFAGDLGQRIFQRPFSWSEQGVEVRGRSRTLRVNYRTSHQIRAQADRLLDPELRDVDGNAESRDGTVSVFQGPAPHVEVHATADEERDAVAAWLGELPAGGIGPGEVGLFVRTAAQIGRAEAAAAQAGLPYVVLDERVEIPEERAVICTMHLAKGLEYRAVAVMACDQDVLPDSERLGAAADESDLDEAYNGERRLLYVACTRARDRLLVTAVAPGSEYLEDMR